MIEILIIIEVECYFVVLNLALLMRICLIFKYISCYLQNMM